MQQQYWNTPTVGVRSDTLGKVLGLLGGAAVFTGLGALLSLGLGRGGFILGLIGSLACVFVIGFVKDRAPANLILLYAFAVFEGLLLGGIVESYLSRGLGMLVLNAASATGIVTLLAGGYGYTTKRDLTKLGNFLFIALIALIVTSLIGIFVHLPILSIVISAGGSLLFTGFLVFDLNRVARAGQVSQGDAIMLAISVYLDVVNLFIYLLSLLGILRGDD